MNAAAASGAMTDVGARISAIQARIDGLVGPGPGRAAPTFQLPETSTATDATAATADARPGATASTTGAEQARTTDARGPATATTSTSASTNASATGEDARGEVLAARLPSHGRHLAGAIEDAAVRAGVEPSLLAALVRHESDFDQDVVSHAGAIGLGQLMPGTAAGLGVDPHDPLENLDGAARYLREQIDRFGAPDLALAAYNAGPNRVAQAGGVPRIAETQAYVGRVMSTWEQLR